MVNVTIRRRIDNPNLSASQWDLLVGDGASMDIRCTRAAVRINEMFTAMVNQGCDRETVRDLTYATMVQFSDTGATDTEPCLVLEGLLDQVFGSE
jgi:hypothetical protein